MPRRPRSLDDPNHPRRRLLRAAANAFAEKGYERASIDEIAEAAGLPKSGVYYYFPSKQALISAIVTAIAATLHDRLDALEDQDLPPAAELEAAITEQVCLIGEQLPAMRVLLRELPAFNRPGLEAIAAERIRYRERLRRIIERGIAVGDFAPVESRIATEALLGLANSLVDWFSPAGPLSAAVVAQTYARLAVRALRPVAADQPADREA